MTLKSSDFDNAEIDLKTTSAISNSKDPGTLTPITSYTTRLGDTFDTLNGRLAKLGYLPPVAYASGISFLAGDSTKTIERDGVVYAPNPSSLPFTTTGTWGTDSSSFYVIQSSLDAGLQFLDIENLVSGTAFGAATPISFANFINQKVKTTYSNLTSKASGAEYIIKTLVQAAADGDVIDGTGAPDYIGGNHALSDGVHCAIKVKQDSLPSATDGPSPQQLNTFHDIGTRSLRKIGRVLEPDPTRGWMNTRVESPAIMWDERDGKYHMVFTGYGTGTGVEQASVGFATSDDAIYWVVDPTPLIDGSGVEGDPDEYGGTGPYLMKDKGTYYLFYIGLTEPGYEGGIKTLCLATKTSWQSPWVRRGSIITLGSASGDSAWRKDAIWHPTVHKKDGVWYLFFNASGAASGSSDSTGVERIGFATSKNLIDWIVDDARSPVISTLNNSWKSRIAGDPSIYRSGDFWFMNYFGYDGIEASDSLAWTTDAEFPVGWREYSAPYLVPTSNGALDNTFAHKPFTIFIGEKKYHYYTAVNNQNYRTIALAISDTNASHLHYADTPVVSDRKTPFNGFSLDRYQSDNSTGPVYDVVHDANKSTFKIERANLNGLNGCPMFAIQNEDTVLNADEAVFLKINNRFNGVNDLFVNESQRAYQLVFDGKTGSLILRQSTNIGAATGDPVSGWEASTLWKGGTDGGFSYDSGWIPVSTSTVYTFAHGIGKTPTQTLIQFSDTAQGQGIVYEGWGFVNSGWRFVTTDDDETYSNDSLVKIKTGQFLTAGNGTKAAATHMRVLVR